MDAADHGKIVLAGILAGRGSMNTKLLDYAVQRVLPEYFVDHVQRTIFVLAQGYADQTGGIIRREALEDVIQQRSPDKGRALMYGEQYEALTKFVPSADQFKHSVGQLHDLHSSRATGEVLSEGMKILRQGSQDSKGRELYGHADARAFVLAELAGIDRDSAGTESPEGDIRHEEQDVLAMYAKAQQAKLHGFAQGILTGIPELDRKLRGAFVAPGEMALIGGYTSSGKTAWCCQLAWHVSTQQRKNVVYFTTETLRAQVRTKLVARHSRLPQFGLPKGLNTRDIREGMLDERSLRAFQQVLHDFRTNSDFGHCYVVQVPRGATISVLEARLAAISRQFWPDLVIVDYLQLLHSSRPRNDLRQELTELVKESKNVAATFGDGRGVPLVSPWQVNRQGRDDAQATGSYTYKAFSETAEAPNSADVLITLLDPPNDTSMGRNVPIDLEVAKMRDGERGISLRLTADFANATFTARDRSTDNDLFNMGE